MCNLLLEEIITGSYIKSMKDDFCFSLNFYIANVTTVIHSLGCPNKLLWNSLRSNFLRKQYLLVLKLISCGSVERQCPEKTLPDTEGSALALFKQLTLHIPGAFLEAIHLFLRSKPVFLLPAMPVFLIQFFFTVFRVVPTIFNIRLPFKIVSGKSTGN